MSRRGALTVIVTALVAGLMGYELAVPGVPPERLGAVLVIGFLGLIVIAVIATLPSATTRHARATVVDQRAGWEEFGRELERSRRHGRPMVILRVPGTEGTADAGDQPVATDPHSAETAVLAFGSALRSVDRTWTDGDSVFFLLPETDRTRGEALIARLAAETRLPIPERVRLAAFPDDGLTSGALIAALGRPAGSALPIPFPSGRPPVTATTSSGDGDAGTAAGERLG